MTPGGMTTLACLLEVSAPKPGNVHRAADFEDLTFTDFATSAVVLGQVFDANGDASLGQTILAAVQQTSWAVGTNTNLGIILLLAPLAKIAVGDSNGQIDQARVAKFFDELPAGEGTAVFEAIRLAKPGGLGQAQAMDVHSNIESPVDLLGAMELSKHRDAIARQYVTGFQTVFDKGVPLLLKGREIFGNLSQAIVFAHVALMANEPDSLIQRKLGQEMANHSQILARQAHDILEADDSLIDTTVQSYWRAVSELDFWLRSDGHRRNPGTTADLIAATLFVSIFNGAIRPPFR